MIRRRAILKLLVGAVMTVVAAPAYALTEVFGRTRITRYGLLPPRWPDGLKLSVAVVADIHACEPWMNPDRVTAIVEQTNALGADIIMLMGDYLGTTRYVTAHIEPEAVAARLAPLTAPLGVYAILGNHDYWADRNVQEAPSLVPQMAKGLAAAGIPVLINERKRLSKGGKTFWVAGLADQLALLAGAAYGRKHVQGLHDVERTLRQIPAEDAVILLAHEPDIFSELDDRVSLTLSGHTHGGQVDLLGWRPVSASSGSKRYPAGHFVVEGRHLIVSKGLGITGLPVRVGCWPEILLLELG